jgi:hypothetical protein
VAGKERLAAFQEPCSLSLGATVAGEQPPAGFAPDEVAQVIAQDRARRRHENHPAITNAVPAWTRTRNWTTALLAFKIHFGDRLPE